MGYRMQRDAFCCGFVFMCGQTAMVANRGDACRRPICRMDDCLHVPYTFAVRAYGALNDESDFNRVECRGHSVAVFRRASVQFGEQRRVPRLYRFTVEQVVFVVRWWCGGDARGIFGLCF